MTTILTKLVNSSLDSAIFPSSTKHAIFMPIIRKHGVDSSSLSSYRPISNLPFVSKLLKRIVAGQLTTYLNTEHLLTTDQSAYRRYHSTETALLTICNDALIAADRGMVTLVVLLDQLAAFDTAEHSTLLDILRTRFGITYAALNWHKTYLSERSYRVVTGWSESSTVDCRRVHLLDPWSSLCTLQRCRKLSLAVEYHFMGLLTTRNSVNTCWSTSSMHGSPQWLTVSLTLNCSAAVTVLSSTLTSHTLSGLAPDNNWPRWAKLTRTCPFRVASYGRQRPFATSVSLLMSAWLSMPRLAPVRRHVFITFAAPDR